MPLAPVGRDGANDSQAVRRRRTSRGPAALGNRRRRAASASESGQKPYAVGICKDVLFIMHGQGDSWEEAFADADAE